jgi:hypothetical protein
LDNPAYFVQTTYIKTLFGGAHTLADEQNNGRDDEFFEEIAEAADFVNKRLGNTKEPFTGINNTVDEYAENDKGEE